MIQQKGDTELWIKLHNPLKAEIDVALKDNLAFLTTQYGKPFSIAGFGNWFQDVVKASGDTRRRRPIVSARPAFGT